MRYIYGVVKQLKSSGVDAGFAKDALREMQQDFNILVDDPNFQQLLNSHLQKLLKRYGTVVREPTRTNLGYVEYRSQYSNGRHNPVAIKVSRINYDTKRTVDDPALEARWYQVASNGDHPCMLKVYCSLVLGRHQITVIPYAELGDLNAYLKSPMMDRARLPGMFTAILFAVKYLHSQLRSAHLDIKPGNIFVTQDHGIIIGDLGVAQTVAPYRLPADEALHAAAAAANDTVARIKDALRAPNHLFPARLQAVPPTAVPMRKFFSTNSRLRGYFPEIIQSISGDPNFAPGDLTGSQLFDAFVAHLTRNVHVTQHERYLSNVFATLVPGLPSNMYAMHLPDTHRLPAPPLRTSVGTQVLMCPNLRSHQPSPAFAADVYSLGATLYYLATGCYPYSDKVDDPYFLHLQHHGVRALLQARNMLGRVSPRCVELLERMMHMDPAQRPSVAECTVMFQNIELNPIVR
jgi:serine/threonine protein kinase